MADDRDALYKLLDAISERVQMYEKAEIVGALGAYIPADSSYSVQKYAQQWRFCSKNETGSIVPVTDRPAADRIAFGRAMTTFLSAYRAWKATRMSELIDEAAEVVANLPPSPEEVGP